MKFWLIVHLRCAIFRTPTAYGERFCGSVDSIVSLSRIIAQTASLLKISAVQTLKVYSYLVMAHMLRVCALEWFGMLGTHLVRHLFLYGTDRKTHLFID